MAQFTVSTAKLTEEAARQRKSLNEAKTLVLQTKSDITRYLMMWKGEAHDAFVNTSNRYLNSVNQFLQHTEQYYRVLDAAVSDYDGAEQAAKRIASQKGQ